ncbi:MAG: hypothetical protein WBQ43_16240 [Terriglobales bacterium]
MANQVGNFSLQSGQSQLFHFTAPKTTGFLPVISVAPLTPSFTDAQGSYTPLGLSSGISFPLINQLGITNLWMRLSDDSSTVNYYALVMNFSDSTVEFAFLEGSL